MTTQAKMYILKSMKGRILVNQNNKSAIFDYLICYTTQESMNLSTKSEKPFEGGGIVVPSYGIIIVITKIREHPV